ncbi:acetyl-CoA synthetase-like protein [Durotheca rogersii]|uniref:acetyl-CoA synthetase-like protein n=1 Tax=Durotheca rogersii TaxID=419775 RepID=UPI00221F79C8|nr:acetyl-CoA synthetase-like protein [Durotheca rogersii]KAI5854494.1 acetyl-CoA synthetase-like protein [Durotheca rogersii]
MQSIAVLAGPNKRSGLISHGSSVTWDLWIYDTSFSSWLLPRRGTRAFFTSHRNSLEAHISLVKRTSCSALLLSEKPLPVARHILEDWPMEQVTTPDLDFFLGEELVEVVPFPKTFEEVRNEPFYILHTSGSTGIPKPVPITYGSYGGMDSQLLLPSLGHKPTFLSYVRGKRVFFALPVFHAASLNWTIGLALFAGVICVLPPPMPLTAHLASQIFQYSQSYGAVMAPSLVVDCYNNDTYCVRMLQSLKFIVYGGGMLPEEVGDVLCHRIRLMTLMGSCETALLPHQMLDDPRDWEYISLSPCLGHIFRNDRDRLGNLTIVRQRKYESHQGVFSTFPQKEEHAMGDLFEPHPLKPGLWRFRGRADDIISFTTAEKLNPSTMESIIQANPRVKSAVIGGQGQFQASLLLEPREYPRNAAEEQTFLDQVWPSIVQANRDCPAHGRIMRGFVMLTDPAKPLPRASKDTVQRHAVFKLYVAEWGSLYERQARLNPTSKGPMVPSSAPPGKPHGNPGEADDGSVLSDKMASAIGAIVERKISAALDRFASALLAAASQLYSMSSSVSDSAPQETRSPAGGVACSEGITNGVVSAPSTLSAHAAPRDHDSKKRASGRLRQIIYDTLAENVEVDDLEDGTDLIEFRLDSLQIVSLLNAINAFIVRSEQPVDLVQIEAIYSNPTVAKLVAAVVE